MLFVFFYHRRRRHYAERLITLSLIRWSFHDEFCSLSAKPLCVSLLQRPSHTCWLYQRARLLALPRNHVQKRDRSGHYNRWCRTWTTSRADDRDNGNMGDVRLSDQSRRLGDYLRRNPGQLGNVGQLISDTICNGGPVPK